MADPGVGPSAASPAKRLWIFRLTLKNNLGELRSKKRFSEVKSIQADPCGFRKPFPYMM
jgi:hypothetical protein